MVGRTWPLAVGGAAAALVVAYFAWRPAMLRWGTEGDEAVEPFPGDEDVPKTHERLERALFHARYVEGKHSATRIHPELQDLAVGDLVPYGGGVFAPVSKLEPNRHLVAGETFVLRPLPGNRTRLLIRYRRPGYLSAAFEGAAADAPKVTKAIVLVARHVPGAMLLVRGVDFFIGDPLHHYMEVGVLRGTKQRAEGKSDHGVASLVPGFRGTK